MPAYDAILGSYPPVGNPTTDVAGYYFYSSVASPERAIIGNILSRIDALIDTDFTAASLFSAHLTFAERDLSLQDAVGITTRYSATTPYASIAIDTDISPNASYLGVTADAYYRYIAVHEIGHALGLKHPFEAVGASLTVDASLTPFDTVMDYAASAAEVSDWFRPLDIAALIELNGIEDDPAANGDAPVYRFYNRETSGHFFTINKAEAEFVAQNLYGQYTYEGNQFYADTSSDGPLEQAVYRFYNLNTHGHFFTINEAERDAVMQNAVYRFEGVGFYAETANLPDNDPVYRFYNQRSGGHFFTSSQAERDNVIATLADYHFEGVAFFA